MELVIIGQMLAGAALAYLVDLRRDSMSRTRLAPWSLGVALALLIGWFVLFELTKGRLPLANPAESFGTISID